MSARSYLSIGDVLTLLRQEFPDITISKIRFLESQGLVNPERTPSGYRKFYEHDVERLRWVLRQQREHFLPLKVIKDRLEDGSATAEANGGPADEGAHTVTAVGDEQADAVEEVRDPVLVGQHVGAESEAHSSSMGAHPAGEAPLSLVGEGSVLPGISEGGSEGAGPDRGQKSSTSASSRGASRPASTTHARGAERSSLLGLVEDTDPGSSAAEVDRGPRGESHSGDGAPTGVGTGTSVTGTATNATTAVASAARRAKPPTPPKEGSGESPRAQKSGAKAATPSAPTPATAAPTTTASTPAASPPPPSAATPAGHKAPAKGAGVSLSAEELAAASGLDLTVVRELQEYGLLEAATVAGVEHFGDEALAVAHAAAGFTRFGIEPRHLRLYKNAAEREAGFVEQVVLPLVRQRNPEARTRAHETAEELTQLGQQLRGSLLRTALSNLLNG